MAHALSMDPAHPARRVPASEWRTQAAIVFGLELAHLTFESVRTDHALLFAGLLDWAAYKSDEVIRMSFNIAAATLALQWIDRFGTTRPHRTLAAVLSMAAAALAGAAMGVWLPPYEPDAVRVGASASTAVWFWYTLWTYSLVNVLALVAIDGLRRRQHAVNHLTIAQERGQIVRQQLASAQLLAIQARVDPQFLFDMLAAVKGFYEHDAARAERLLDELSAFLRAALPRLRSARSTLEIECGLVQRYVQLLRGAGAASIDLKVELRPDLAMAVFPAGVLLPLFTGSADTHRCIALSAAAMHADLCVRVVDTAAPADATLQRLQRSLSALHGERGKLRLLPEGSGARIELEVPLELC
jgi:hypothetical protein